MITDAHLQRVGAFIAARVAHHDDRAARWRELGMLLGLDPATGCCALAPDDASPAEGQLAPRPKGV